MQQGGGLARILLKRHCAEMAQRVVHFLEVVVMKYFARSVLAAALVSAAVAHAQTAASPTLPGVTIYATGGTIAGASASNTDTTNYKAGSIGVQTLIDAVPELKKVARIDGEQIANVGSSDIDSTVLLKLAKAINAKLADPATQGVVVTHGTDTLAESAFFIDVTVNSPKPVVFVGAMRPATAISADGPMNLLNAVTLAASKDAMNRGTLIALNDRFGSAFYTIKTNSTTVDTFKAEEQGFLGTFTSAKPYFWFSPATPVGKVTFDVSNVTSLPKVVILYAYQDQDAALIDAAIKDGAKGIVIDGSGNGSINSAVKKRIAELDKQGFPVVRATRTNSGLVTAKTEGIGASVYSASKSRWLLSLALSTGLSYDQIKSMFGG
ncbi:asparaginase [Comamonas sp. BIGb0124]|uniref:type II asparaginase n=1 Tax=Comamonas sp. BIGb0124 TaxID=2485130 RepID=UPI000F91145E|nr:asparaginase [Comamonas sp. BIGb0124]